MRYCPVFLYSSTSSASCWVGGSSRIENVATLREADAPSSVIPSHKYRDNDLAGARRVVDASEVPEVNRCIWEEAERAEILTSIGRRRDPILIATSTSGETRYLARAKPGSAIALSAAA